MCTLIFLNKEERGRGETGGGEGGMSRQLGRPLIQFLYGPATETLQDKLNLPYRGCQVPEAGVLKKLA
jgi:hypothetical protein